MHVLHADRVSSRIKFKIGISLAEELFQYRHFWALEMCPDGGVLISEVPD